MAEKKNDFGIASMILGISSVVFCWTILIGIVAGVLGIIFSVKQRKIFANGFSTAGLVTSIVGISLTVIIILLWVFVFLAIPYRPIN
jgi:hypothetical protein